MEINISRDPIQLGKDAGSRAATLIREAIAMKGSANIILATGTSQFETLNQLIAERAIDWSKVVMFHLDEYIGLSITAPASFRKYLTERFLSKVPTLKAAYLINGEVDAQTECDRLNDLIKQHPIDVHWSGLARTAISRLMTLRQTLKRKHPTSLLVWMKRAGSSSWVKVGSSHLKQCRVRRLVCR